MKNSLKISTLALALALVATPAFAQVSSATDMQLGAPIKAGIRMDTRADIQKKHEENREIRSTIIDAKGERVDMMKENKAEMDAKLEARKAEMEALKIKLDSATTKEEKEAIKAEFEASRGEFKADVKSSRDENRVEMRAKTAEIHALRAEAIGKVYSAMIERLEKLSTRISSRVEKLGAEGQDMTTVKASLSVASSEIALAKADYAKLSVSAEKGNKEIVVSMKAHLKSAHEAMVKVLGDIKGLRAETTITTQ